MAIPALPQPTGRPLVAPATSRDIVFLRSVPGITDWSLGRGVGQTSLLGGIAESHVELDFFWPTLQTLRLGIHTQCPFDPCPPGARDRDPIRSSSVPVHQFYTPKGRLLAPWAGSGAKLRQREGIGDARQLC